MPRATFGKDRRLLKASEYKEVFDNNAFRVAHPKHLLLVNLMALRCLDWVWLWVRKMLPLLLAAIA